MDTSPQPPEVSWTLHRTDGRQDSLSCAGYLGEEYRFVAARLDALPWTRYKQRGVPQILWGHGAYLGRRVHRNAV